MGIFTFIEQKLGWVLALDTFEKFRRNPQPVPARLCQFGHAVFSGNNVCNYGHHAA
jgi:hypothetical protein